MHGLMLHCGGDLKSREEVFSVPVPPETSTYKPLSYQSFVERIEKQLKVEGITLRQSQLALAKNGQRLFGLMELEMPGLVPADYGLVLGLRTSYDKSFANGLCIGASVFVCDNLSFNGEVKIERKHTAGMLRDLTWIISETVSMLPMRFGRQSAVFESYRKRELDDKDAHDLVVRFWDEGAIGLLDIPKLIKEWRDPRHPEFSQTGRPAWRLFNAATETIKGDLWSLPKRTQTLHRILDEECRSDGALLPGNPRINTPVASAPDEDGEVITFAR